MRKAASGISRGRRMISTGRRSEILDYASRSGRHACRRFEAYDFALAGGARPKKVSGAVMKRLILGFITR